MRKLILLLLIIANAICESSDIDTIYYEGLRLDMSILTFNRDILNSIRPALNRTANHTFTRLYESGTFGTSLYITNIKISKGFINEDRFNINSFTYKYPIYTLGGTFRSIYFAMNFDYDMRWIGFSIASGSGSASVTNIKNEVQVLFNESDPDVKIPPPWDVMNVTLPWNIFSPAAWIESLLEKKFVIEFDKALDDAMYDFAHLLLKNYRYIEDAFPNETDLVFRNEIIDVKPTIYNTYMSIGFKTNITVDGYYRRKVHRRQREEITPRDSFEYCLAAQLIPDTIDVLGKAGYYKEEVSHADWGFNTNHIRELFEIIPSLKKHPPEYTFSIICETSMSDSVNDLGNHTDSINLRYLYPFYCYFYLDELSEQILTVDVFLRIYYEMKSKTENQAFYGHVQSSEIYGFKTFPDLPEGKKELLGIHVSNLCGHFQEKELASPGIIVTPNRHEQIKYEGCYMNLDEICFYFSERS